MGFGDLKSDAGIKTLNDYLSDRSYVDGYIPSQADNVVFTALQCTPAAEFIHALRWYNHISSYGNEKGSFPGPKKNVESYGPVTNGAADEDSDDDIDLFGKLVLLILKV